MFHFLGQLLEHSCDNTDVPTAYCTQMFLVFTQLYCNSCLNKAFQRLLVENSLF